MPIGRRRWAIAEGYLPEWSHASGPQLESHETACILNTGATDAQVTITIFYADRDPVGPYRLAVPARRTLHVRFNDLREPAVIPKGVDFSSVIESDVPIVVQHTRLDSRQAANALLSTIAFADD
ncbi:MAG TPA: sensory rhodopsin transducer [Polyangia bacterium]|nr:sensory rhodopsin transducer [Polyangia bacterium]